MMTLIGLFVSVVMASNPTCPGCRPGDADGVQSQLQRLKEATKVPRQASGYPAKWNGVADGKLFSPAELRLDSDCYIVEDPKLRYGTQSLVDMVEDVYCAQPKGCPSKIMRLSDIDGGYLPPSSSHRNGLDMDVYYPRKDCKDRDQIYVDSQGNVSEELDLVRLMNIMKEMAKNPEVLAVYVDRKIKKAVCEIYKDSNDPNIRAGLALMRPGYGGDFHTRHRNHYHVRMKCPSVDTCIGGCDDGEPKACKDIITTRYQNIDCERDQLVKNQRL